MILSLVHSMQFAFEHPVFLDPVWLRLRPRTDPFQTLLSFHLESLPEPDRIERMTDLDGNGLSRLWFSGSHPALLLKATSRVRTLRSNPFDFLFQDPRACALPMSYPPRLAPLLAPYLLPENASFRGPLFRKFMEDLQDLSRMETVPFLAALSRHIPEILSNQSREEGPPRSPEETLEEGSGSCRDFALLAMEACRALNIAARFTSGYHLPSSPSPLLPHLRRRPSPFFRVGWLGGLSGVFLVCFLLTIPFFRTAGRPGRPGRLSSHGMTGRGGIFHGEGGGIPTRSGYRRSCFSRRQSERSFGITSDSWSVSRPFGTWPERSFPLSSNHGRGWDTTRERGTSTVRRGSWRKITETSDGRNPWRSGSGFPG